MGKIDPMYKMLYNMKMAMWKDSEIYQEYMKARNLHQEILNAMSKDIDTRNLGPEAMLEAADAPDFDLNFKNQMDKNIFGDMIVYTHLEGFPSLTDEYLNHHRFKNEDHIELLKSMQMSRLGVYEFVARDDENAVSMMRNVLTKEEIPVSDRQLGDIEGTMDDCQCMMRVIRYGNIYFQTGLMLSFKRNHTTRKWLNAHKTDLMGDNQLLLLVDAFNFFKINGKMNM